MGFLEWLSRLFGSDSDAPPTPRQPALPRQQPRAQAVPRPPRGARAAAPASRASAPRTAPSGPVEQAQLVLASALAARDWARLGPAMDRFFQIALSSRERSAEAFLPAMQAIEHYASHLCAIRRSGPRTRSFEPEHARLLEPMERLIEEFPFFETSKANPAVVTPVAEALMIRMIHLIGNRRIELCKQLRAFMVEFRTECMREHPLGSTVYQFIWAIGQLAPRDDPSAWEGVLPARDDVTFEGLELPVAAASALADFRKKRALGDVLTRALSEPARAEVFAQFRAANGPGSPAEQLGSAFVLQLLPTVEGLPGPAVVIGYVDPPDCPSAVPEILKGRHLSIHLEHEGQRRRLVVMNENSGQSLSAEPAGPVDVSLASFAESLRAASGLHVVALARANEPVVVRDAWERTGSVDLTGDVLRAVDARRQGRAEDALTLLRQAASADEKLAGVNRLMSLILRDDLGKGDCPEVRELLETERRRAPATGMAEGSLGILAKRADDFHQAASLLEASLALQPNDIGHLMTLANVYVCQGGDDSIDRLISVLSRVHGLAPEDDRLSTFLARLKAETGVDLEIAVRTSAIDCSVH